MCASLFLLDINININLLLHFGLRLRLGLWFVLIFLLLLRQLLSLLLLIVQVLGDDLLQLVVWLQAGLACVGLAQWAMFVRGHPFLYLIFFEGVAALGDDDRVLHNAVCDGAGHQLLNCIVIFNIFSVLARICHSFGWLGCWDFLLSELLDCFPNEQTAYNSSHSDGNLAEYGGGRVFPIVWHVWN